MTVGISPQDFRRDCRDAARRLEQLVVADLGGDPVDPSALLAEARRRALAAPAWRN